MIKNSSIHLIKNNFLFMILNSFISLKTDLINFMINFISIILYIVIIADILGKQVTNYLQFLLPGLIVINLLSAVSYQALKIWNLGSSSKLMAYWLSLPYSLEFQLLSFSFMAIFNSFLYTLPLIIIGLVLNFPINVYYWLLIIFFSSSFLFFINLFLVLYLFKTNSFIIVFNVSQPLLLRISPVFYPLIYLPIFALPLSYLNPVTWIVESLRGYINWIFILFIFIFLNLVCYLITVKYWKQKVKNGELI